MACGTMSEKLCVYLGLALGFAFLVQDLILYFRLQLWCPDARIATEKEPTMGRSFLRINGQVLTFKTLMLDPPNYYVYAPAAITFNTVSDLSERFPVVTPNAVSLAQVTLGLFGATFIMKMRLWERRIGVVIFMLCLWLDCLDGVIARARRNIRIEMSEPGTAGFYIDGLCDSATFAAFLIPCLILLRRPVSNTSCGKDKELLLPATMSSSPVNSSKEIGSLRRRLDGVSPVYYFGGQLFCSSLLWNYAFLHYHKVSTGDDARKAKQLMHSMSVFIPFCWRYLSPHALFQAAMVAVFYDKHKEFFVRIRLAGYGVLSVLGVCTLVQLNLLEAAHQEASKSLDAT